MQKLCKVCGQLKEFGRSRSVTCDTCLAAGYKYCTTCNETKDIRSFRVSGYSVKSKCIPCERLYNASKSKELYDSSQDRRDYIKEAVKVTRGTSQGRQDANSYSSTYYSTPEGKEQNRLASNRWYATEEGRLYAKNKSHRRRLVTSKGNLTLDQWHEAIEYFNNSCAYCGCITELTLDHITALRAGGEHEISNIVPACKSCNSSKHANELVTWYTHKNYFDPNRLQRIIDWRLQNE